MKKCLSVVVSSRLDADENSSFIDNVKDSCGECDMKLYYLINKNGVSLTKVYGDILNKVENDIVVFVHDDVVFLKNGWGDEILKLFENNSNYGIIGVAGSSEFDERGAWWEYDDKYGQVAHIDKDSTIWLTQYSKLLKKDLQDVCVVDGVFMAVNRKKISDNFDMEFTGFDHYDTSFCLSNYVNKKCKIGVTTNIRLLHKSTRELSDNWIMNRNILNKKFNKYYPIKVNENE